LAAFTLPCSLHFSGIFFFSSSIYSFVLERDVVGQIDTRGE
jgi:hypothetical protein